jgi:hypothetical protein
MPRLAWTWSTGERRRGQAWPASGNEALKGNMAHSPSDKLAVLIDAENAQAVIAAELLAEISRYGTATHQAGLWGLDDPKPPRLEPG